MSGFMALSHDERTAQLARAMDERMAQLVRALHERLREITRDHVKKKIHRKWQEIRGRLLFGRQLLVSLLQARGRAQRAPRRKRLRQTSLVWQWCGGAITYI